MLTKANLCFVSKGSAIPATTEIWTKWAPPIERSMLVAITLSGVLFGFIISLPLAALVISYFQWEANFYFTGNKQMMNLLYFYEVDKLSQMLI